MTIESHLGNVALVSTSIQGLCKLTALSPVAIDDVQLCVAEGINNVIKHSYANQVGHEVIITVTLRKELIMIEISNDGSAMDPRLLRIVTAPSTDNLPIEQLPEGGWGLYIIKTKMDEVTYHNEGQTHTLRMIKFI
jgi:serine/threonine-protein kinase RsbW